MSDAPAAVAEMARVARRVAVCMWGVEEVDMFAAIDRTAAAIGASRATEPRRYRTPQEIHDLLAPHGEVETAELDVTAGYRDFDEFWQAMDRGVGPAGQWVASLDAEQRASGPTRSCSASSAARSGPFELEGARLRRRGHARVSTDERSAPVPTSVTSTSSSRSTNST